MSRKSDKTTLLLFLYTKNRNEVLTLTKNQKIEILQKENARLQKELERVNYLTTDEIKNYVEDHEMTNRELFIELQALREKYIKTFAEASKLLNELREVAKIEKVNKRKFPFKR